MFLPRERGRGPCGAWWRGHASTRKDVQPRTRAPPPDELARGRSVASAAERTVERIAPSPATSHRTLHSRFLLSVCPVGHRGGWLRTRHRRGGAPRRTSSGMAGGTRGDGFTLSRRRGAARREIAIGSGGYRTRGCRSPLRRVRRATSPAGRGRNQDSLRIAACRLDPGAAAQQAPRLRCRAVGFGARI
jgi:hypothetical protein